MTPEEEKNFYSCKRFIDKKNTIIKLSKSIDSIINIFKTPEYFYNPKKLEIAEIIKSYIIQLSIFAYPKTFEISHISNYHSIKKLILNKDQNIFLNFFDKEIKLLIDKHYDYIGISISDFTQLVSGLTFACLLREKTNAHINIGGNLFSKLIYKIKNHSDFFDLFANSISYGEGEISIIKLAKYINNEFSIEEVPNLIYKKNNEVKVNEKAPIVNFSQVHIPDYTDIDFSQYLIPDRILPLTIERGCYWGKCAFCDMPQKVSISTKRMDNLISEIKYYKEKYNISSFSSVDESISPALLEKFSDAINSNNLKINFYIRSRLEKEFTYKILKKAYQAGLKLILWGLESTNKRILDLMNKGTNSKYFYNILKVSKEAGIWNHIFLIYNFPTETYKEALETVNFVNSNKENIHSIGYSEFVLTNESKIYKNPKKYQIKYYDDYNNLNLIIKHKCEKGMLPEEVNIIKGIYREIKRDLIPPYFGYDRIFKYLLHYSREEIIQLYKKK